MNVFEKNVTYISNKIYKGLKNIQNMCIQDFEFECYKMSHLTCFSRTYNNSK